MPENNEIGIFDKYTIEKKDGITDPNADYFVLRLDTDPHARIALKAYADSIRSQNRNLSMDIYKKLANYGIFNTLSNE